MPTITNAELRYTQSLWYAWGRIDSGAHPGMSVDDGFTFAAEQKEVRADFDAENTHMMPSIINAWDTYVTTNTENTKE